ncbi:MAG: amidohydrolase [Acidimicrobiia bacterium]
MRTSYTNARIWTGAGTSHEAGSVIVDGTQIEAVTDASVDADETVDLNGAYVLPGLIDAHSHTGIWGEGGQDDYDGNEISASTTPYIRTIDSIYPEDIGFDDSRRGGVTTLGIMHGSANAIGGQTSVVKAAGSTADEMVIRAPAGVKMALGENPKKVGEHYKREPNSRMGVAWIARRTFYEAIEYRKDLAHHEALVLAQESKDASERVPLREPKRDLGKEMLLRVLDREFPIRNHAHRMDDIRTAIRLSDEFGYDLVIDHGTEAYRIADEIADRGIPLALGPMFGWRSKREVNKQTAANVGFMVERGVSVSVMTDSPFAPVHHLRDLVILAIREGLDPDDALATVTMNPANLLGVSERVGSLEEGKDADFIVMDGDPWDARSHVLATYINGVQVHERTGPYLPL